MNSIPDMSVIKSHPYLAAFDGVVLGPLAEAPVIEPEDAFGDSFIYENGGREEIGKILLRHKAKITVRTKNISVGLDLLKEFAVGTDLISQEKRKELKFTPISSEQEAVLSFHSAVLMPELSYRPGMGEDHVVTLTFYAYPDASGQLFTFE